MKTVGKLKREGLLDVPDIREYRGQVFLKEALWAAELEPRIYELLPAIVFRRPGFFAFVNLPEDLVPIMAEMRTGELKTPYKDIPPEKYGKWVEWVGFHGGRPKVMKSFRLGREDLDRLERIGGKTEKTATEILQEALRVYSSKLGLD